MTPPAPRRLVLIASPTRDTSAPIRRFRLGRVLMGPEQLIGQQAGGGTWSGARERHDGDGRWRV